MLFSLLLYSLLLGDTIKESRDNLTFIQLYTQDYCTTFETPVSDSTFHYTLIPTNPDIALYFGYSTINCVSGISIEDVILRDMYGNIVYTGFLYSNLVVDYIYTVEVRVQANGACLGIDNLCPYYIIIDGLAVELCNYTLGFNDKVFCKFDICSSTGTKQFIIDRSADLIKWNRVGTVKAEQYSSVLRSYQFFDSNYLPGVSYYRIIEEDVNGNLETIMIDYVVSPEIKVEHVYDLAGRLIR